MSELARLWGPGSPPGLKEGSMGVHTRIARFEDPDDVGLTEFENETGRFVRGLIVAMALSIPAWSMVVSVLRG